MTLDEWMATAAASLDLQLADLTDLTDLSEPGETGETGELGDTVDLIDVSEPGDVAELRVELLNVARDAAHGVARPAAPLTTFLLGVAVGRGMTVSAAAARIRRVLPAPPADGISPAAP